MHPTAQTIEGPSNKRLQIIFACSMLMSLVHGCLGLRNFKLIRGLLRCLEQPIALVLLGHKNTDRFKDSAQRDYSVNRDGCCPGADPDCRGDLQACLDCGGEQAADGSQLPGSTQAILPASTGPE